MMRDIENEYLKKSRFIIWQNVLNIVLFQKIFKFLELKKIKIYQKSLKFDYNKLKEELS